MLSPEFDVHYYVAVAGETAVGKASLIRQFKMKMPPTDQDEALIYDFTTVYEDVGGRRLKIVFKRHVHRLTRRSCTWSDVFSSASAVLIVFDLTHRQSFLEVPEWMKKAHRYPTRKGFLPVLVGNKSDLANMRQVQREEAEELAGKYSMLYIETTAPSHESTRALLLLVAESLRWQFPSRRCLAKSLTRRLLKHVQFDTTISTTPTKSTPNQHKKAPTCCLS